jgi:hypothetical protein
MTHYHFKIIRQPEFKLIKTMLDAGIKVGLVAKATKRSWLVVKKISESGTIEEYKKLVADYTAGCHKKQNKTVEVKPDTGKYPHIVALLDVIVAQLTGQGQDLDKIKKRLLILS